LVRSVEPRLPKVLVTGDTGFVGRHVVRAATEAGWGVVGFRGRRADADVADPKAFEPFEAESVDAVVHLAARTFVPDSWRRAAAFDRTNVTGTAAVLEYCRRVGARLIFSSSYVYGVPRYLPIDEDHPTCPSNPYAACKLRAEWCCGRYAAEYGVPVTVFRPGNIYGPGQDGRFLVPTILQQICTRDVIDLGDPRPGRDMVYVDDIVRAIMLAVEDPAAGFRAFNLGCGRSYSVAEVADELVRLTGFEGGVAYSEGQRPNEIPRVVLDSRRAHEELGWPQPIPLSVGLARMLKALAKATAPQTEPERVTVL
jgi:UDP-glucose 4-epimerase